MPYAVHTPNALGRATTDHDKGMGKARGMSLETSKASLFNQLFLSKASSNSLKFVFPSLLPLAYITA